jgi:hypothetical protein
MKPKTNKTQRRKLRGLEVAQAALLLVIGVVVALVLFFVATGLVASTPAPNVQVDSFNSILAGDKAKVVLKFGKSGVVSSVTILGNDGEPITGECTPSGVAVNAGQQYIFDCQLLSGKTWQSNMIVKVVFADNSIAHVRWVTG